MNPFHIGDIVQVHNPGTVADRFKGQVRVMDVSKDLVRFNTPDWWHHSHFHMVSEGLLTRMKNVTGTQAPHPLDKDVEPGPWTKEEKDPKGLPAAAPGAKNDKGKVEAGLLLDFGLALTEVAKVCTFGAQKYSRQGWLHVDEGERRYRDAGIRHLLASSLEDNDPESDLLHLSHMAWNVLAELELRIRRQKPTE